MSSTLCPRCKKSKAEQHPVYGVIHCKNCRAKDAKIKEHPEFYTMSMQDRIQGQRDRHLKDIMQPWDEKGSANPDFAKAYGKEAEDYLDKEELEKL